MIECVSISDNLLEPKVWIGEIRRDTQTGRTMWAVQRVGDKTFTEWKKAVDEKAARVAMAAQLTAWGIENDVIEETEP